MQIKDTRKLPYLIRISILANSTASKNPDFAVIYGGDEIQASSSKSVSKLQTRYHYEIETTKLSNLSVSLLNKESNDTKLVDDKIVEDLYVAIEDFSVDDINLKNKINSISSYLNENNVSKTYGFLGFNGTMTLKVHHNLLYTDIVSTLISN